MPSHLYCFSVAPNPRWSRSFSLLVLTGLNTGLGHNSQVFMIEAQIRYVTGAVTHARRRGAVQVAVRPEAETAYDRVLQGAPICAICADQALFCGFGRAPAARPLSGLA